MGTCPLNEPAPCSEFSSAGPGGAGTSAVGKGPFFTLHGLTFMQKPLYLGSQAGLWRAEWVWLEAGPGSHSETTFTCLRKDVLDTKRNLETRLEQEAYLRDGKQPGNCNCLAFKLLINRNIIFYFFLNELQAEVQFSDLMGLDEQNELAADH